MVAQNDSGSAIDWSYIALYSSNESISHFGAPTSLALGGWNTRSSWRVDSMPCDALSFVIPGAPQRLM